MNQFSGYTRAVPGGHWAMLRFAHDARPAPVLGEGGKPIVFTTECEAWQAVTKHLLAYFNTPMRRDGAVITNARSAAETLFRPGRKPIPVEVRRA